MATSMANSRLSPAAALLRNSRLFALPPPISLQNQFPTTEPTGFSSTSTTPFPTHASIETHDSSRARGDWGLKRPLPLRSTTHTSNPIIRVKQVDTITHITDFESAADHTLTLQKWQSLSPVIKMPRTRGMSEDQDVNDASVSVFEAWLDNILDRRDRRYPDKDEGRWVFQGPWIAGQTDTEFSAYVEKSVRTRKAEFHRYLREQFTQQELQNARRIARDQGEHDQPPPNISESAFRTYLKSLRTDHESLGRLIHRFLDLATPPRPASTYSAAKSEWFSSGNVGTLPGASTDYAHHGPPLTHPSAGFSYLRTRAFTPNHFFLGPQLHSSPVQARVLQSKTKESSASMGRAILGVGGLTTGYASNVGYGNKRDDKGITTFDPDIPGGAKLYVQPSHMHIDSKGKIQFRVRKADPDTVALHTEPSRTLPDVVQGSTQMPVLSARAPASKPTSGYGLEGPDADISRKDMMTEFEYEDDEEKGSTERLLDILKPGEKKRLLASQLRPREE